MTSKRPNHNTYWVRPGQLLAGEYPGAWDEASAAIKLEKFLDCGVDYFIDLTEEDELHPYAGLLKKLAAERGVQVQHHRFAIPDRNTPSSAKLMQDILHSLREALAKQHTVYVHCFGGIGRTGTVIGCYLSEEHQDAKAGLAELAQLWQQMEKKNYWPDTPQTSEQHAWVMAWPVENEKNMKTLKELLKKIDEGKQFNYLHFWGHRQAGLQPDKAYFSQWFIAPFQVNGITYPTAEHYMMAGKARLFGDEIVLKEILASSDPDMVKRLGRKVKNYDESTWAEHRLQIVVDGNYAKFSQNPKLAQYLLGTADKIIVEASPLDQIWGTGLAQDHPDCNSPHLWPGLNLLGFALMEVRSRLLAEQKNKNEI